MTVASMSVFNYCVIVCIACIITVHRIRKGNAVRFPAESVQDRGARLSA